jgi:hypothetical protein
VLVSASVVGARRALRAARIAGPGGRRDDRLLSPTHPSVVGASAGRDQTVCVSAGMRAGVKEVDSHGPHLFRPLAGLVQLCVVGQGSAFRLASPGELALVVVNTEGKPQGRGRRAVEGALFRFMHDPVGCAGGKTCAVVSCALPRRG